MPWAGVPGMTDLNASVLVTAVNPFAVWFSSPVFQPEAIRYFRLTVLQADIELLLHAPCECAFTHA